MFESPEAFRAWCGSKQGPLEVFRQIDHGANSLTKQEFLQGLKAGPPYKINKMIHIYSYIHIKSIMLYIIYMV